MARSGVLTSKDVAATLIEEERRQKSAGTNDDTAYYASGKGRPPKSINNSGTGRKCYRCQKEGHVARYCRATAPAEPNENSDKANVARSGDFSF